MIMKKWQEGMLQEMYYEKIKIINKLNDKVDYNFLKYKYIELLW